jgi:serine/threonine protein phosphatase 1
MQRYIVIGDIHGCFVELKRLLVEVGESPDDVLVSVGDLVDRGPESPEVVRYFRERPNTHVIVGNHERKHIRGIFSYAQEITRLQFGGEYEDAVQWMRSLPYFLELDTAIVVHAALMPERGLTEQKEEILCGSTSGEKELEGLCVGANWYELYAGPKPVIFGHRVVDEPFIRPPLIYGIDTGACHGGRLTALILPDFRLVSVTARADHWKKMKCEWQAEVLSAKPWEKLLWQDLDAQLERFREVNDTRSMEYLRLLREWRAELDLRVDGVLAALDREAARLEAKAGFTGRAILAKQHPLSKFLFQSFGGRLNRDSLINQVHTPKGLDAVAEVLGFERLVPPSLPDRTK